MERFCALDEGDAIGIGLAMMMFTITLFAMVSLMVIPNRFCTKKGHHFNPMLTVFFMNNIVQ